MAIRGWWLAAVLAAGAMPACSEPVPPRFHLGEVARGRLVPIGDEYLLVERPDGEGMAYELLDHETTQRKRVPLPGLPGCTRTTYDTGFGLSPYELGVRRECVRPDGSRTASVVGYELRFGKVRVVLARSPDADAYVRLGDRDLLGWFREGDCTWFQRYRPGRRDPRPLGFGLAEDGWPLDQPPPEPGACRDHGMVALPAVNVHGQLAFVASPAARGLSGKAREKAPFSVYVASPEGARPLAELAGRPRALDWYYRSPVVSVSGQEGGVYVLEMPGRRDRLSHDVATSLAAGTHSPVMLTDDGDIFQISLPVE